MITTERPDRTVIRDHGAAVSVAPGAPCTQDGDGAAACRADWIEVDAGDGDDRVTVSGKSYFRVRGGLGDDQLDAINAPQYFQSLAGEDGNDILIGGPSSDTLSGGTGSDMMNGGAGDDELIDDDATPARDRYDGGTGRDRISYRGRAAGVTVRLGDPGSAGTGTEGDALFDIEDATGGMGADLIVGDRGPNRLEPGGDRTRRDRLVGGPGNDELSGDGGGDRLLGGTGADVLSSGGGNAVLDGGPGDDWFTYLKTGGQPAARVRCGSGFDVVHRPLPATVLERRCDRIETGSYIVGAVRLGASRDGIVFRIRTPSWRRLFLRVRRGPATVAHGIWRLRPNVSRRITVRPNRAGRRELRDGGAPTLRFVLRHDRRRAYGELSGFTMTF